MKLSKSVLLLSNVHPNRTPGSRGQWTRKKAHCVTRSLVKELTTKTW